MSFFSIKSKTVHSSLFFIFLIQLLLSTEGFAGAILVFSQQEVIAVTSLEHSSHRTFDYPADDILSIESLGKNRADLICESAGFSFANSYTTRESERAGEFIVFESLTAESMRLPVVNLIEFIDAAGTVISFGEKAKLQGDESRSFKRHHSKKKVPHLLFSEIDCE